MAFFVANIVFVVKQDPSRQHGDTISSSRNTQYLPSVNSTDLAASGNEAKKPLSVKERTEKHFNYARGMFL